MNPVLLQQQIKNNNEDLYDFCKDLKSWGEEMKNKELKKSSGIKKSYSVMKSSETNEKKANTKQRLEEPKSAKKKCMTYEDWEKFDVEKECEKINEDSDSELTDEFDENMKEEAFVQKEKGNRFVKSGKWNDAIKCYTKAIEYFAYDPIFYANRALCYLKLKEMEKAESDCNVSLKLDNTYVKAYQRRAVAREALNKLEEAKLDLMRVLELEPKNCESKNNLEKLKLKMKAHKPTANIDSEPIKPVSKFSASRQQKNLSVDSLNKDLPTLSNQKTVDLEKPPTMWPSGEHKTLVKAVNKPPHLRSKEPLVRVPIEEINSVLSAQITTQDVENNISSWPRKDVLTTSIKSDDFKVIEHKTPSTIERQQISEIIPSKLNKKEKDISNNDMILNVSESDSITLTPPKTSVQFFAMWRQLKGLNDKKYELLRLIDPHNIPNVFGESLESQTFSEILLVLTEHGIKRSDTLFEYLLYLTRIKRFSALCMFFTINDKNCLWKMFNQIKEHEEHSKEDIDDLISKYEL